MNGGDDEADWPCVPWIGRRLWTLRARYRLLVVADRWCHQLRLHDHDSGVWPCFEVEDVYYAGLFMHDQREHDRIMERSVPARVLSEAEWRAERESYGAESLDIADTFEPDAADCD